MSLASILGPTGRGPLVVLSPHLDDAVLSLGATIARLSRHGRSVRVVTAFANDPTSRAPAGPWGRVLWLPHRRRGGACPARGGPASVRDSRGRAVMAAVR